MAGQNSVLMFRYSQGPGPQWGSHLPYKGCYNVGPLTVGLGFIPSTCTGFLELILNGGYLVQPGYRWERFGPTSTWCQTLLTLQEKTYLLWGVAGVGWGRTGAGGGGWKEWRESELGVVCKMKKNVNKNFKKRRCVLQGWCH